MLEHNHTVTMTTNASSSGGAISHTSAPHSDDAHASLDNLPRIPGWAVLLIVIVLAVLLAAMFFIGWIPHSRRLAAAQTEARQTADARPIVETLKPRPSAQEEQLTLPADVRANQATSVFARVNGYLKPLPPGIDIGARVKSGQLIAEIAAPDLDAQLEQARAALEQARAVVTRMEQDLALTDSTLKRYETASLTHAVSDQDLDEKRAQEKVSASALKEAQSNVAVADAAVKRLGELQGFEQIRAPFSGVITARAFDAGALITSGDTNSGRELFRIQDTDVLRVEVNVPQAYATDVPPGRPAELLVRNFPGRTFAGKVARAAGAIDASTRTLPIQVDVPNSDGTLMPGMYGQVRINCRQDQPPLVVPASALVIGVEGVRIAVLEGTRVRLHPITLGRDFGAEVEVVNGLTSSDTVVLNPGSLVDGAEVVVKKTQDQAQGH